MILYIIILSVLKIEKKKSRKEKRKCICPYNYLNFEMGRIPRELIQDDFQVDGSSYFKTKQNEIIIFQNERERERERERELSLIHI